MVRKISTDTSRCNYSKFNQEKTYCAVVAHKLQDSCDGDSGGPLMLKIGNSWHLYGLTSFGDYSCESSLPSYYTKVPFYLDWIKANI